MEKRNIQINLETAKQWFNGDDKTLKELALQAYTVDELTDIDYAYICKKLFNNKKAYFMDDYGLIVKCERHFNSWCFPNNCTSEKQLLKILALNKLINIAKYFNSDWEPDWKNDKEFKYAIMKLDDEIRVYTFTKIKSGTVYFKSKEDANKAIKILGDEINLIFD